MNRIGEGADDMLYERTEAGATLAELLIVLSIAAILTAAAFPAFASANERLALRSDAERIKFILRRMHGRALGDQLDHAVIFDLSAAAYYYAEPGESIMRTITLTSGTRIAPPPLTTFPVKDGKTRIVFEASGWGSGGTLALASRSGKIRKVIVNFASGRVVTR